MNKTITINISEEQANYLQRLGAEVDAKVFLLDRMFSNHATDTDTILFDSIPFQHYMEQYREAVTAYDLAKQEFQNSYLDPIMKKDYGEDVKYNWSIDDFLSLECKVTVID